MASTSSCSSRPSETRMRQAAVWKRHQTILQNCADLSDICGVKILVDCCRIFSAHPPPAADQPMVAAVCDEHPSQAGRRPRASGLVMGRLLRCVRHHGHPRAHQGLQHRDIRLVLERAGRLAPRHGEEPDWQAQRPRAALRDGFQRARIGGSDGNPQRQDGGQLPHDREARRRRRGAGLRGAGESVVPGLPSPAPSNVQQRHHEQRHPSSSRRTSGGGGCPFGGVVVCIIKQCLASRGPTLALGQRTDCIPGRSNCCPCFACATASSSSSKHDVGRRSVHRCSAAGDEQPFGKLRY